MLHILFSADGRCLAGLHEHQNPELWPTQTGRPIPISIPADARVQDMVFSSEGYLLLATQADHTITLWKIEFGKKRIDPPTLTRLRSIPGGKAEDSVVPCRIAPQGDLLAIVGQNGTIILWNTHTWTSQQASAKPGKVQAMKFSPDGRFLAIGLITGDVRTTTFLLLSRGADPDQKPKG